MKGYLGEFEELVLLAIASLAENAYGVSIKAFIERHASRPLSIGSLHSTISRLEEKGHLTSKLGEPTQERGGRRKRYYEVTESGKAALHDIKDLRDQLWVSAQPVLTLPK